MKVYAHYFSESKIVFEKNASFEALMCLSRLTLIVLINWRFAFKYFLLGLVQDRYWFKKVKIREKLSLPHFSKNEMIFEKKTRFQNDINRPIFYDW